MVVDSSGVTLKGSTVVADGSMVKIASGPGSSAGSGSAPTATSPADPTEPFEADEAEPGRVDEIKREQASSGEGRYGAVDVQLGSNDNPNRPPINQSSRRRLQNSRKRIFNNGPSRP